MVIDRILKCGRNTPEWSQVVRGEGVENKEGLMMSAEMESCFGGGACYYYYYLDNEDKHTCIDKSCAKDQAEYLEYSHFFNMLKEWGGSLHHMLLYQKLQMFMNIHVFIDFIDIYITFVCSRLRD